MLPSHRHGHEHVSAWLAARLYDAYVVDREDGILFTPKKHLPSVTIHAHTRITSVCEYGVDACIGREERGRGGGGGGGGEDGRDLDRVHGYDDSTQHTHAHHHNMV